MLKDQHIPQRLTLKVIDEDPDYLLLEVSIADGTFAGSTRIYASRDVATELRSALGGFPRTGDDRREVVLGAFGPKYAGGGVRLVLRTATGTGHCVLEAEIEDEPSTAEESPRTAVVRLPVKAASIDAFVKSLSRLTPSKAGAAVLLGAGVRLPE